MQAECRADAGAALMLRAFGVACEDQLQNVGFARDLRIVEEGGVHGLLYPQSGMCMRNCPGLSPGPGEPRSCGALPCDCAGYDFRKRVGKPESVSRFQGRLLSSPGAP
jgi:hypothetical protein